MDKMPASISLGTEIVERKRRAWIPPRKVTLIYLKNDDAGACMPLCRTNILPNKRTLSCAMIRERLRIKRVSKGSVVTIATSRLRLGTACVWLFT